MAASNRQASIRYGVLLAATLLSSVTLAAPYTPATDTEMLQLLPPRIETARQVLDPVAAAATVQTLIEAARREADPRYLGQAQAILSHWNDSATTPTRLLVLRATVQQSLHRFNEALDTLAGALRREPANVQALLTRATIQQLRGDYRSAAQSCQQLSASGASVPAELCLAGIASMTGRAAAAEMLVLRLLDGVPAGDRATRVWGYTLLAEGAERQGDVRSAERYFLLGLAEDAGDRYLTAAYCDWLLDQHRPQEVLRLTAAAGLDDNLLLRRALAFSQLRDAQALSLTAQLRERHNLAARRGERTHLREEARLSLWLEHDPAHALALAQQNWQQQKESADLRILLEAAAAARSTPVRQAAWRWLQANGIKDARIEKWGAA